jgi:hypothetical protein
VEIGVLLILRHPPEALSPRFSPASAPHLSIAAPGAPGAAGTVKIKIVPPPALGSARILPPWASMMDWQIES